MDSASVSHRDMHTCLNSRSRTPVNGPRWTIHTKIDKSNFPPPQFHRLWSKQLWTLSLSVRDYSLTLGQFTCRLKTVLFQKIYMSWFHSTWWQFSVCVVQIKNLFAYLQCKKGFLVFFNVRLVYLQHSTTCLLLT